MSRSCDLNSEGEAFKVIIRIRQSSARTFNRCKRKYKLSTIDRLIPVRKSIHLSIGTACHAGRATWLRTRDVSEAVIAGHKSIEAEILNFPSLALEEEIDAKQAVMEVVSTYCASFIQRFPSDSIQCLGIELPFELKLAEFEDLEMYLEGTIDGDVIYAGKYRMNFEYKTTKKTLNQKFDEEYMSIQHPTYCLALQSLTREPIYGTIVDVSRRALKTKGPEHGHILLPTNENELAELKRDHIETLKQMRYFIDNDYFPPNFDACFVQGRCEYYPICKSRFDPHVIRNGYAIVDDLQPLLREEEERDANN